jgi:formylglycine-generating enzyme required for sulfatase activity
MKNGNVPISVLVGMALAVLGANSPILADEPSRDLLVTLKAAPGSVPIGGNYWALLVGIDDYQQAPKLETAVKDVVGVRDVLVGRYGFSLDHVITLINAQATRTNIEHELYKLGQLAKEDDSVFIYYAGHGQYEQDGRLGWWVPVEGQPRNPGTFITNSSIRDYINGMKARHVYLVADSCFSGTLFGRSRAMPPIDNQFYARLYAKQSRWGLTSGGTEPVADRGKAGHSIFAYHFIGLLKENPEPYLIPTQIYDRIAPVVANNASQTPRSEPLQNAGDEGGQFVFRLAAVARPAPAAPALKKGPSAALAQAEQELNALQAQESLVEQEKASAEEERKLQEIQQQIAQKKQQIAEKRKAIEEARARPYGPQPAPEGGSRLREITGKDGATMVVVPAGEFWMGSTQDEVDGLVEQCMRTRKKDSVTCRSVFQGEKPRHKVRVSAFAMDKYEVTNRLFAKFVEGTGHRTTAEREGWGWGLTDREAAPQRVEDVSWKTPARAAGGDSVVPQHPVSMVSWEDAAAYCRWAGKRLPSEAEWEYAARAGTTGAYWWGDRVQGARPVANLADETGKQQYPGLAVESGYSDGSARTSPVGSYEANPWGLHDMIGNVWEWTADWYDPSFYRTSVAGENPKGPASGTYRVVRGGSWRNLGALARAAYRGGHAPSERSAIIGFRCVQDAK